MLVSTFQERCYYYYYSDYDCEGGAWEGGVGEGAAWEERDCKGGAWDGEAYEGEACEGGG